MENFSFLNQKYNRRDNISPDEFLLVKKSKLRHVQLLKWDELPEGMKVIEEIGRGNYGVVYRVTMKDGINKGNSYIMKIFLKSRVTSDLGLYRIIKRNKHKNIVNINDCRAIGNRVTIIFSDIEAQNLNYFRENLFSDVDSYSINYILLKIIEANIFLNEKIGLYHGDISEDNILIDSTGEVKLCDFGSSFPLNKKWAGSGTPIFLPLELINNNLTDYSNVDTWSIGVVLYYFLNNKLPYENFDNSVRTKPQLGKHMTKNMKEGSLYQMDRSISRKLYSGVKHIIYDGTDNEDNLEEDTSLNYLVEKTLYDMIEPNSDVRKNIKEIYQELHPLMKNEDVLLKGKNNLKDLYGTFDLSKL